MMAVLMKHQWRLLSRQASFWALLAFLVAALSLAGSNAQRQNHERAESTGHLRAELNKKREDGQRSIAAFWSGEKSAAKEPWDDRAPVATAYGFGQRPAVLDATGLSALAVGVAQNRPVALAIAPYSMARHLQQQGEGLGNPALLMDGFFDPAFVLVFLAPLVVIVLGFRMLAEDRETRRDRLLLLAPITPLQLLAARTVLLTASVLLPVLLATLGTVMAAGRSLAALADPALWVWWAVAGLYLGVWATFAAAVNALGRSSTFNLVALGALWLVWIGVVPTLGHIVIDSIHPQPSAVMRIEQTREMMEAATRSEVDEPQRLEALYRQHPEYRPPDNGSKATRELRSLHAFLLGIDAQEARLTNPADAAARLKAKQRGQAAAVWSMASPAVTTMTALQELAGNGISRYQAYLDAVSSFRDGFKDAWWDRIYRNDLVRPEELDRLPEFRFESPPPWFDGGVGRTLIALGVWLLLATLWMRRRLRGRGAPEAAGAT